MLRIFFQIKNILQVTMIQHSTSEEKILAVECISDADIPEIRKIYLLKHSKTVSIRG